MTCENDLLRYNAAVALRRWITRTTPGPHLTFPNDLIMLCYSLHFPPIWYQFLYLWSGLSGQSGMP
jgi:hypothetical protein